MKTTIAAAAAAAAALAGTSEAANLRRNTLQAKFAATPGSAAWGKCYFTPEYPGAGKLENEGEDAKYLDGPDPSCIDWILPKVTGLWLEAGERAALRLRFRGRVDAEMLRPGCSRFPPRQALLHDSPVIR